MESGVLAWNIPENIALRSGINQINFTQFIPSKYLAPSLLRAGGIYGACNFSSVFPADGAKRAECISLPKHHIVDLSLNKSLYLIYVPGGCIHRLWDTFDAIINSRGSLNWSRIEVNIQNHRRLLSDAVIAVIKFPSSLRSTFFIA